MEKLRQLFALQDARSCLSAHAGLQQYILEMCGNVVVFFFMYVSEAHDGSLSVKYLVMLQSVTRLYCFSEDRIVIVVVTD